MFSKNGYSLFGTATFRLAVRHAGLLAALSLAMFALVYVTLQASLTQRTDKELAEDVREAENKLAGASAADGVAAFLADSDPGDAGKEFRVLLSPRLKIRASSDLSSWS